MELKPEVFNIQDDAAHIDQLIERVYEAICFPPGSKPNMHQLKPLFIPSGLMINYNEDTPQIFTVETFIDHFNNLHEQGIMTSLEDKEVKHETKIYGKLAHRFSFYEARFLPSDKEPFAVGVNSMQFIKVDGEWKVSVMSWNDDKDGSFFGKW